MDCSCPSDILESTDGDEPKNIGWNSGGTGEKRKIIGGKFKEIKNEGALKRGPLF